jgi:rubrerythrin
MKVKNMNKNLLKKYPPSKLQLDKLEMLANYDENKKNTEFAVLFALADGKTYTEKEIMERIEKIQIVAAIEVNRRKGLFQVSKNFDWFTKWTVKLKNMECPKCSAVWEVSKKVKNGKCPVCNLDIKKYTEKLFPNLKKITYASIKRKV